MISAACRKLIKQALCMKLGESTLISCSCHNLMKIKSGDGERLSATRHPFGSELIDLKPDQNRAVVGGNVGVPRQENQRKYFNHSKQGFVYCSRNHIFTINKKKLINFLWSTITQTWICGNLWCLCAWPRPHKDPWVWKKPAGIISMSQNKELRLEEVWRRTNKNTSQV